MFLFVKLTLHCCSSAVRYFMEGGVLQIVNVSHRDQGVYTCLARTPMDGDKAAALLLVLGEPNYSVPAQSTRGPRCCVTVQNKQINMSGS